MSLLNRLGGTAGQTHVIRQREVKQRVRGMLYERVSSERIAKMVGDNPALARKELDAVLLQIMEDPHLGIPSGQARSQLRSELLNDILGLGPIEPLLADPSVTEIMVNGPDAVFYERAGVIKPWPVKFDDDEHVLTVIDRIVAPIGRRVDERSPMVNARLPEGHRVNAIIPPLALCGPTLTIRKFRTKIFDLAELARMGALEPWMMQMLSWGVRSRKNIAVTGGTGSGKTTLLNALSIEIPENERIVTVEDSAELRFQKHPHVVSLEARPANLEGEGEVSIRDLVINCLRMRPDRIVVGECRGGEALDMLQAMNTGHDGSLTTLHANTPAEAVSRLVTMVRYVADLPVDTIRQQVSSAISLIVHQDRMSDGSRRITKVVESAGMNGDQCVFDDLVRYVQDRVDEGGRVVGHYEFVREPSYIQELMTQGIATAEEVDAWRSQLPS